MDKSSIIYIIIFFLSLYILLIIFGKKLQTISTFPQTGFEKIKIKWIEKIELNTWSNKIVWIYLDNNKEKTIYYFHGNGGNLNIFENQIKNIGDLWYNVLSYDYPGYGESTWIPTEDNVYKASELFYNYLLQEKNIKKENIILYWYSIWAAVAVDLAYKKNIKNLILMSPFTSRYEMGKHMFWFNLPKYFFLKNSFVSEEKIKHIKSSLLIIHGEKDKLIPFYMWEKLYQNAKTKEKFFVIVENAWHNNISYKFINKINPYIIDFLENKKIPSQILVK